MMTFRACIAISLLLYLSLAHQAMAFCVEKCRRRQHVSGLHLGFYRFDTESNSANNANSASLDSASLSLDNSDASLNELVPQITSLDGELFATVLPFLPRYPTLLLNGSCVLPY